MKARYTLLVVCPLILAFSCDPADNTPSGIGSLKKTQYYESEIFPPGYLGIYGKWELTDISGGIAGSGHDLDFQTLEIRKFGVYGIVRDGNLVEYGKVVVDKFEPSSTQDYLQVRFVSDVADPLSCVAVPGNSILGERYAELTEDGQLNLYSPCCDMYNHHFRMFDQAAP